MRITFILFFVLMFNQLTAQNLVMNPGFEGYWYLPSEKNEIDSLSYGRFPCKNWYRIKRTTPDYWNKKNNISLRYAIPYNELGYHPVIFGNAYVGFAPLKWDGCMEPITGEFKEPMKKGMTYEVSFYYSFAGDMFYLMLDKLEVYISPNRDRFKYYHIINYEYVMTKDIKANVIFKDKLINNGKWHQIKGTYYANGGEKFITFGIFYQNKKLYKQIRKFQTYYSGRDNPKEKNFCEKHQELFKVNPNYKPRETFNHKTPYYFINKTPYYFIDNVSVELITESDTLNLEK